jgi:hypothetical protein
MRPTFGSGRPSVACSAAEREAVHRRDDRLEEVVARREAAEARARDRRHAVLGGPLEVVAGGERLLAGAGQDGDPDVVVGRERVPHAVHLLVRRRVQRVHRLRAVDGEPGDVVAALEGDELQVLHAGPIAHARRH